MSPLYDVNPSSDNKRVLSTYITENDNSQSIDLAMEVCEYFGIKLNDAKAMVSNMRTHVSSWNIVAKKHGLKKREIEMMESAFILGISSH